MGQDDLIHVGRIFRDAVRRITADATSWETFLRYASRFYQFSFENQVLMYAQRETATFMAPLSVWFKAGHYPNPNEKGIVIFDTSDGILKTSYVFDVSQTHGGGTPKVWELEFQAADKLISSLNQTFGVGGTDTIDCILKAVKRNVVASSKTVVDRLTVEMEKQEYSPDLVAFLKKRFRPLAEASCKCIVAFRCNLPELLPNRNDLESIYDFGKPLFLSRLGLTVQIEAQRVLVQIENFQKTIDKERELYERINIAQDGGKGWGDIPHGSNVRESGGRQAVDPVWETCVSAPGQEGIREIRGISDGRNTDAAYAPDRERSEQPLYGDASGDGTESSLAEPACEQRKPEDPDGLNSRSKGITPDRKVGEVIKQDPVWQDTPPIAF